MHRVDAPGNVDGLFSDGNPAIGQQATQVRAEWLNDLQENVCTVIEEAGRALEKGNGNQLLEAIQGMVPDTIAVNVRIITANTTYVPTDGTKAIEVLVVGAGGGGGGSPAMGASQFAAAGGGGSGGWGSSYLTSGFDSVAVTVGTGGAGGVGNANGSAGGDSSFGTLVATGGGGGVVAAASTTGSVQLGGTGGACTGANRIVSAGTYGHPGIAFASGNMVNGAGGNSIIAAGGGTFPTATSNGVGAGGYGAGGSGAEGQNSGAARNGGAGGPGVVIVREYR